ncbi:hypothetical protein GKC34_15660 (plasmid) [Lactobacillus salivarius]|uniref:Uncharacterized protein n=2 Tax=Ligilactobacillus salivarius TaxID=1624 RepID=A0A6A8LQ25_9LACO|nr:hypothetical protein [Ligilactobacillus salivarius]MSE07096.1 hypothetical protein [Ligilactobacillus salivarius]
MAKKIVLITHENIIDESKLKYTNVELISVQKFREFLYDFEGFKDIAKKEQLDNTALTLAYEKLEESMLQGKKLIFSIFKNDRFEGEVFQSSLKEMIEKYKYELLELNLTSIEMSNKYAHPGYFRDSYNLSDVPCNVVLEKNINNEDLKKLTFFLEGEYARN